MEDRWLADMMTRDVWPYSICKTAEEQELAFGHNRNFLSRIAAFDDDHTQSSKRIYPSNPDDFNATVRESRMISSTYGSEFLETSALFSRRARSTIMSR
jgi:hypothetical protein